MTTFIEYTIEQNATFKTQLQLKDDIGVGINLIPYTVTSQVRRSYTSGNVSANITCTYVDGANGLVQLSIPYANTATMKSGRYVYDVTALNTTTGEELRLVEGIIVVTPSVTR